MELIHLERVDSTNNELKRRIAAGLTQRLALWADEQTAGRGRRSRSFLSLPGKGLYLSAALIPKAPPEEISALTPWCAVAVSRVLEELTGVSPDIKWPNDLQVGGKKLCGILTEWCPPFAILGVGVNLTHTPEDFGPDLSPTATSLAQLGTAADREVLARALADALDQMASDFPHRRAEYFAEYRRRCVTLGRQVRVLHPAGPWEGRALDLGEDFSLLVRRKDGGIVPVTSGEVSIRPV